MWNTRGKTAVALTFNINAHWTANYNKEENEKNKMVQPSLSLSISLRVNFILTDTLKKDVELGKKR